MWATELFPHPWSALFLCGKVSGATGCWIQELIRRYLFVVRHLYMSQHLTGPKIRSLHFDRRVTICSFILNMSCLFLMCKHQRFCVSDSAASRGRSARLHLLLTVRKPDGDVRCVKNDVDESLVASSQQRLLWRWRPFSLIFHLCFSTFCGQVVMWSGQTHTYNNAMQKKKIMLLHKKIDLQVERNFYLFLSVFFSFFLQAVEYSMTWWGIFRD